MRQIRSWKDLDKMKPGEVAQFHPLVQRVLVEANPPNPCFPCSCGRKFESRRGLSLHRRSHRRPG